MKIITKKLGLSTGKHNKKIVKLKFFAQLCYSKLIGGHSW